MQMAELEAAADALVELESRAEVAESERDAALAAGRSLTPRPGLPAALPLAQRLGPAGAARLDEALQLFRCGSSVSQGFPRPAPHAVRLEKPCIVVGYASRGFGLLAQAKGPQLPGQSRAMYHARLLEMVEAHARAIA